MEDRGFVYGIHTEAAYLSVQYKVELNDQTTVDWTDAPRHEFNIDEVLLPVTTEFFGERFYEVSIDDQFKVTFKVGDLAGNFTEITFNFRLDVITPLPGQT